MSEISSFIIPPTVSAAMGEQGLYESSLDYLNSWLGRGQNKYKVQIASIIDRIIEYKAKHPDDDVFPDKEDIDIYDPGYSSGDKLIDQRYDYFKVGRENFDFSGEINGRKLYKNAKNFNGYKHKKIYVEYMAHLLVTRLKSTVFLNEFDSMPLEYQTDIRSMILSRLEESYIGRCYMAECNTFQIDESSPGNEKTTDEKPVPLFSYFRLKKEAAFLNTLKGTNQALQVANNTSKFIVKYSTVLSSKLLDLEQIKRVRGAILHSVFYFYKTYIDEPVLDGFSDFIEELTKTDTFPGYDPDIDDVLEDYFKVTVSRIKGYLNKDEIVSLFPAEKDGNLFVRVDTRGIFARISTGLSMISLGTSLYEFNKENSWIKGLAVTDGLLSVVRDFNEFKTIVPKGTNAARFLHYTELIGVFLSSYDSYEAYNNDDFSVAIGHGAIAAGQAAAFVAGFLVGAAAMWWTGIGLLLLITGVLLVYFTADAITEWWFRNNYFGENWATIRANSPNLNPDEKGFLFSKDFTRHIIKFNSLLFGPILSEVIYNKWGVNINIVKYIEDEHPVIPLLEGIKDSIAGPWDNLYHSVRVNIENKTIDPAVTNFGFTLHFWDKDKKEFFWNSEIPIYIYPLSTVTDLIDWTDNDVIFVYHELAHVADSNGLKEITNYNCHLLIKKTYVFGGVPNNKNFSHCEVRFFNNKENSDNNASMLIIDAKECSH